MSLPVPKALCSPVLWLPGPSPGMKETQHPPHQVLRSSSELRDRMPCLCGLFTGPVPSMPSGCHSHPPNLQTKKLKLRSQVITPTRKVTEEGSFYLQLSGQIWTISQTLFHFRGLKMLTNSSLPLSSRGRVCFTLAPSWLSL